jgi:hypothetical protein
MSATNAKRVRCLFLAKSYRDPTDLPPSFVPCQFSWTLVRSLPSCFPHIRRADADLSISLPFLQGFQLSERRRWISSESRKRVSRLYACSRWSWIERRAIILIGRDGGGGEHLSFLQMFGFYDFERCLMPVPLLVASCNPLARRRCWRDRRKARREKVDVRRKQKEPFVSSFPFGTSLEAIPGRLAG